MLILYGHSIFCILKIYLFDEAICLKDYNFALKVVFVGILLQLHLRKTLGLNN